MSKKNSLIVFLMICSLMSFDSYSMHRLFQAFTRKTKVDTDSKEENERLKKELLRSVDMWEGITANKEYKKAIKDMIKPLIEKLDPQKTNFVQDINNLYNQSISIFEKHGGKKLKPAFIRRIERYLTQHAENAPIGTEARGAEQPPYTINIPQIDVPRAQVPGKAAAAVIGAVEKEPVKPDQHQTETAPEIAPGPDEKTRKDLSNLLDSANKALHDEKAKKDKDKNLIKRLESYITRLHALGGQGRFSDDKYVEMAKAQLGKIISQEPIVPQKPITTEKALAEVEIPTAPLPIPITIPELEDPSAEQYLGLRELFRSEEEDELGESLQILIEALHALSDKLQSSVGVEEYATSRSSLKELNDLYNARIKELRQQGLDEDEEDTYEKIVDVAYEHMKQLNGYDNKWHDHMKDMEERVKKLSDSIRYSEAKLAKYEEKYSGEELLKKQAKLYKKIRRGYMLLAIADLVLHDPAIILNTHKGLFDLAFLKTTYLRNIKYYVDLEESIQAELKKLKGSKGAEQEQQINEMLAQQLVVLTTSLQNLAQALGQ